jgi:hypothetical protein
MKIAHVGIRLASIAALMVLAGSFSIISFNTPARATSIKPTWKTTCEEYSRIRPVPASGILVAYARVTATLCYGDGEIVQQDDSEVICTIIPIIGTAKQKACDVTNNAGKTIAYPTVKFTLTLLGGTTSRCGYRFVVDEDGKVTNNQATCYN